MLVPHAHCYCVRTYHAGQHSNVLFCHVARLVALSVPAVDKHVIGEEMQLSVSNAIIV
eukprot:COSAG06_NODE_5940_length_3165_cov_1.327525_4_plen_57_part_01